jgi:hypothetical protein
MPAIANPIVANKLAARADFRLKIISPAGSQFVPVV